MKVLSDAELLAMVDQPEWKDISNMLVTVKRNKVFNPMIGECYVVPFIRIPVMRCVTDFEAWEAWQNAGVEPIEPIKTVTCWLEYCLCDEPSLRERRDRILLHRHTPREPDASIRSRQQQSQFQSLPFARNAEEVRIERNRGRVEIGTFDIFDAVADRSLTGPIGYALTERGALWTVLP